MSMRRLGTAPERALALGSPPELQQRAAHLARLLVAAVPWPARPLRDLVPPSATVAQAVLLQLASKWRAMLWRAALLLQAEVLGSARPGQVAGKQRAMPLAAAVLLGPGRQLRPREPMP